jgi:hypothetical protein
MRVSDFFYLLHSDKLHQMSSRDADAVYVLFLCEVAFRHSNYNSTFLKLRALGTTTYAGEDQAVALVQLCVCSLMSGFP